MSTPETVTPEPVETVPPVTPAVEPVVPPVEAAPVEKPAEEQKVEPVVYTLTKPDGALLTDANLKKFEELANKSGLTQEAAQAILEQQNASIAEFKIAQEDAFKKAQESWAAEVNADPVLGGANFAATAETAKRAIKHFATPQFVELLERTGFGNHPEMVRTFNKIGKLMGEDTFIRSNEVATPKKSRADNIYGKDSV